MEANYKIDRHEDGTITLVVKDRTGCPITFDGIKGNLMESSDMESYFEEIEEGHEPMTLATTLEAAEDFFQDWEISLGVIDELITELMPWFKEYALPEADAIRNQITDHKENIAYCKTEIERHLDKILGLECEIEKLMKKLENERAAAYWGMRSIRDHERDIELLEEKLAKLEEA